MSYTTATMMGLGVTPQGQAAAALYDEGGEAYTAGNYILAERKFREAYETMPLAIVLVQIARTVEAQGRTYEAYQLYERYLRQEPSGAAAERATAGMERTRPPKTVSITVASTTAKPLAPPPTLHKPLPASVVYEDGDNGTSVAVLAITGVGILGLMGLGYFLTRPKKVAANRRRQRLT